MQVSGWGIIKDEVKSGSLSDLYKIRQTMAQLQKIDEPVKDFTLPEPPPTPTLRLEEKEETKAASPQAAERRRSRVDGNTAVAARKDNRRVKIVVTSPAPQPKKTRRKTLKLSPDKYGNTKSKIADLYALRAKIKEAPEKNMKDKYSVTPPPTTPGSAGKGTTSRRRATRMSIREVKQIPGDKDASPPKMPDQLKDQMEYLYKHAGLEQSDLDTFVVSATDVFKVDEDAGPDAAPLPRSPKVRRNSALTLEDGFVPPHRRGTEAGNAPKTDRSPRE